MLKTYDFKTAVKLL